MFTKGLFAIVALWLSVCCAAGAEGSEHQIFQQRECNGPEDCELAQIENEQTEASRNFERVSRTSLSKAVTLLGNPDFVLRAGDKVPVREFDGHPTETGLAEAIVLWANGPCAANELHIAWKNRPRTAVAMPGGTECTRDGKPFPLPTDKFSCKGGRKSDTLCSLANVLKLPGMDKPEEKTGDEAKKGDPTYNAGIAFGAIIWAEGNCEGSANVVFRSAMQVVKRKSPAQFDAGGEEGFAQMKRIVKKDGPDHACGVIQFLYGPSGSAFPGAWLP